MRRIAGGLATLLACVAFGAVLLGVPVLLLQAPVVTRALVARYYDPATGRLPLPVALRTAEQVRVYTTRPGGPALPATVEGRPGFDAAAASHLRDVRKVLLAARAVTLACAAALALALSIALGQARRRAVARVLRVGTLGTLALVVLAGAYGLADFERFFALFHGLFFAAGTWTFPAGSLLIELFPEPLWAAFGALWALGVLSGAALALVAAWRLTAGSSSQHGEDV